MNLSAKESSMYTGDFKYQLYISTLFTYILRLPVFLNTEYILYYITEDKEYIIYYISHLTLFESNKLFLIHYTFI